MLGEKEDVRRGERVTGKENSLDQGAESRWGLGLESGLGAELNPSICGAKEMSTFRRVRAGRGGATGCRWHPGSRTGGVLTKGVCRA